MKKFLLFTALVVGLTLFIIGWSQSMPKKMPQDFHFSVSYGVGGKNEINTFQQTFTKDLVLDGTVTTKLTFTDEELTRIYNEMRKIKVMKLNPKSKCFEFPISVIKWNVQANGETKMYSWSGEYCNQSGDIKKLFKLKEFILEIVVEKEEYKKLPKKNGSYL